MRSVTQPWLLPCKISTYKISTFHILFGFCKQQMLVMKLWTERHFTSVDKREAFISNDEIKFQPALWTLCICLFQRLYTGINLGKCRRYFYLKTSPLRTKRMCENSWNFDRHILQCLLLICHPNFWSRFYLTLWTAIWCSASQAHRVNYKPDCEWNRFNHHQTNHS